MGICFGDKVTWITVHNAAHPQRYLLESESVTKRSWNTGAAIKSFDWFANSLGIWVFQNFCWILVLPRQTPNQNQASQKFFGNFTLKISSWPVRIARNVFAPKCFSALTTISNHDQRSEEQQFAYLTLAPQHAWYSAWWHQPAFVWDDLDPIGMRTPRTILVIVDIT